VPRLVDVDLGTLDANGIASGVNLDTKLCRDEPKVAFAVTVKRDSEVVVVKRDALLCMIRLAGQARLPTITKVPGNETLY
jgi:hypothetical protein